MRKTYDRTFKLEIVRKVVAKEITVSSVASEYNRELQQFSLQGVKLLLGVVIIK